MSHLTKAAHYLAWAEALAGSGDPDLALADAALAQTYATLALVEQLTALSDRLCPPPSPLAGVRRVLPDDEEVPAAEVRCSRCERYAAQLAQIRTELSVASASYSVGGSAHQTLRRIHDLAKVAAS